MIQDRPEFAESVTVAAPDCIDRNALEVGYVFESHLAFDAEDHCFSLVKRKLRYCPIESLCLFAANDQLIGLT
jgi:hypothetical protein